jgi:hypothetical protein
MNLSSIGSAGRYSMLFSGAAAEPRTSAGSTRSLGEGDGTSTDVLEISAAGQAASATKSPLLGLQSLFDVPAGQPITLDNIESAQNQAQAAVQARLKKLFADKGIDTSHEIRLQIGADGQVVVGNDHPQRTEIEKLFKDNPTLRDQFARFSSLTEMAGAAREAAAFQAAYARDPAGAVAQYSYLFDGTAAPHATLSILNDQYQALLERPGGTAQMV